MNENSSAQQTPAGEPRKVRTQHSRSIGAESSPLGSDVGGGLLQSSIPTTGHGGWGTASSGAMHASIGVSSLQPQKTVSRRSSVVSTSSSFFDRSFFSTPESRIVDHGKKATLSYATLMLNVYNNISLDIKAAVDASRRVVVQTVASKNKTALIAPDLARVRADTADAIDAVRSINHATEFASIKDLLCHSLQVYEDIKQVSSSSSHRP
ncbi:hypothetical protein GGI23_002826 [Coemansia sp. RSA 2559]|nr:hypothetical protein GGI23_002826 [Coemansia sp. RSA 2559]